MRTVNATLLLVLAASPLLAQTASVSGADACIQLEAQALQLTAEKLRCEAAPAGLILSEVSASVMKALEKGLFPEQRYLGYAIVPAKASEAQAGPSIIVTKAQAVELKAAQARIDESAIKEQALAANFDNSSSRLDQAVGTNAGAWGLAAVSKNETFVDAIADTPPVKVDMMSAKKAKFVLVQGPPGSGGGQQNPPRQGPPGSGDQGRDTNRGGPPGSGNPGQNPPGGTTPPSRPAPVWRSNFPPPAPNWWNTDFDHYDWWSGLPSGYDRPHTDTSNPDTFYYYSEWYRWRDTFVTNWGRTEDSATISRTAANQGQIHSRSLTSQVYRESKDCYYQAVYRYDWAQGGFNGSHWEERFDHYSARCIRNPREYGRPQVYTSHVSFDMSMVSGQELPWESDVIHITYDGSGQPRYDFSGAAFKYTIRLDNQSGGSESVTLLAGAKNLRAPEADKVQAFLRVNAGKIEFVINDDRASYYQGETLRVSAKVVRRVVIKVKGVLWGWNEKNVDSVISSSPVDVLTAASNSQNITDLTSAASAPKPANAVRSSVFIEYWEFARVNSRISTGAVIRKGQGNSVAN